MLIAPDIQNTSSELNDLVTTLISKCNQANIPIVYALTRKLMGKTIKNGAVKLAVVGVLNVSGAEQLHQTMLDMTGQLVLEFKALIESLS